MDRTERYRERHPAAITSSKARMMCFPGSNSSAHRGFTLLELLVVIGIISILLVAIVPAVNSLSKSSGRKAAVNNLLGAIEQARVQAIKDGQAAYLVFPTFATSSTITDP